MELRWVGVTEVKWDTSELAHGYRVMWGSLTQGQSIIPKQSQWTKCDSHGAVDPTTFQVESISYVIIAYINYLIIVVLL